jgi:AcrR family transcriptional regulator
MTEHSSGCTEYSSGMSDSVRDRIVDAALERFATDGVLATSVADIRRAAGVSVGAVYHHFADKQALADAAWLRALTTYQDGFLTTLRGHPDPEGGVRAIVAFHLQWVQRNRGAAALLFAGRPTGPAATAEVAERNRAFFDEVLVWWRAHAHHGALLDLDPTLINALWIGPAQEYCRHWVAGRSTRISPAVVRALSEAAWRCLNGRSRP